MQGIECMVRIFFHISHINYCDIFKMNKYICRGENGEKRKRKNMEGKYHMSSKIVILFALLTMRNVWSHTCTLSAYGFVYFRFNQEMLYTWYV